ncbi:MAG: winged helix-turn-helix domain-containing protein, partial [Thaumarchaeota archaeon]|nr:winged helix-turn-helix domain-containing protein [Nitrososphaerota archaeon]
VTQQSRGIVVKLEKSKEQRREGLTLTKRKPKVENYVQILRAISSGANLPTGIVLNTKISWITAMQCLRSLEQNGFIKTTFDYESQRSVSALTEKGQEMLAQIARIGEI